MESHSQLYQALDTFYPVSATTKKLLREKLITRQYPKGHLLLRPGQTPSYAWFLEQGAARGYFLDEKKGEEVTAWFWLEGEVMVALDSFCRQVPTSLYVELLDDSVLRSATFGVLEQIAAQSVSFRRLERAVVEDYLLRISRHYFERSSLPVRHRYEKLMEEWPRLFHIAPVKDIASFLGMFPDTLSRLRAGK